SIPGSTFPACCFAPCTVALKPVRPALHHRYGLFRRDGFLASARCLFASALDRLRRRSPLSSGSFHSLGIKAFYRFCRRLVRLPHPPDRRSLPDSLPIASVGNGSSLTARYVSGGWLLPQTSWNLLHYAPEPKYGQAIFSSENLFHQLLSGRFFNNFPICRSGTSVDKTRAGKPVFGILKTP
ncbi:MAG TPA: hypothetical protein VJ732_16795, partial [Bryobacteraceae bacterium]|nr:hypothetical protein [Bryobacteraceae bacterium]